MLKKATIKDFTRGFPLIEEARGKEKRNSSTLPVQWLAASRTIQVDSGIEADKHWRYDIVRNRDITPWHVSPDVYSQRCVYGPLNIRSPIRLFLTPARYRFLLIARRALKSGLCTLLNDTRQDFLQEIGQHRE